MESLCTSGRGHSSPVCWLGLFRVHVLCSLGLGPPGRDVRMNSDTEESELKETSARGLTAQAIDFSLEGGTELAQQLGEWAEA